MNHVRASVFARAFQACVLACLLGCGLAPWGRAQAQALPVQVSVSGDVASVDIGSPLLPPLADLTLDFEGVSGLTSSSLGVSARLVSLTDPGLLSRLQTGGLGSLVAVLPLLVTLEPPVAGGLSFRTVRVEVHTHLLPYTQGSSFRLFKAPLGGAFVDITDEIAPGSVRARGTTGGFSQFLILLDIRTTSSVVAGKIAALRARVNTLPAGEQPAFHALLDQAEDAVDDEDFADAIAAVDAISARALARAGTYLLDQWRAARDLDNQAGDLVAGAATLKFSIAYLRDYGE